MTQEMQSAAAARQQGKAPAAPSAAAAGRGGAPARWVSAVLLAAGIVILAAFAATTNFGQVARALTNVRAPLLALAAAAVAVQIGLKGIRWQFMIHRLTGIRITTRFGAASVIAGVAAGSVTPGRSFELAKAVMLKASYDLPLGVTASAMIVERLLDMAFLLLIFLAAAAFVPTRMVLASRVLVVMILLLVVVFAGLIAAPAHLQRWLTLSARRLPLPHRLRERGLALSDTFFASFLRLRAQHTVWLLLVMTAGTAALDVARVAAVFQGVGAALALPRLAFAYLGAAMVGMALLIPGGVGVTEVSMAGLIALLAPGIVAPPLARSAVLIDRFLSYYLLVVLGAAVLVSYQRLRRLLG